MYTIYKHNLNKKFRFVSDSGGSFDYVCEDGIGWAVVIQAKNASHANEIALTKGIYFDGCERELDCDCCCDRWTRVTENDLVNLNMYDVHAFKYRTFIHYLNESIFDVENNCEVKKSKLVNQPGKVI